MFLIYSAHRSGSTKLALELDARSPERVLVEPFHPDRPLSSLEGGRHFLLDERPSGIKELAAGERADWISQNHDLFERVVIIRRDPVEIAVSLALAERSGRWHNADEPDRRPVEVSNRTIEVVKAATAAVERLRAVRRSRGMRTLAIPYGDAVSASGALAVAFWLGVSPEPVRPVEPIRGALGPSVQGTEIATNLAGVREALAGHPWEGI